MRSYQPFVLMDEDGNILPAGLQSMGGMKEYVGMRAKELARKLFNPFHDHLTSLILKDNQVMWTVNRLNALQDWEKLEATIRSHPPIEPIPRAKHTPFYLEHHIDTTVIDAEIGLSPRVEEYLKPTPHVVVNSLTGEKQYFNSDKKEE